jgi:hypothetical protein
LIDFSSCVRNKTLSILYKLKELAAYPSQISDWLFSHGALLRLSLAGL